MKNSISIILVSLLFVVGTSSFAADSSGLSPGDRGYRHSEFHPHYQKLFAKGKCNCEIGECRPTSYRPKRNGPSDFEVKIDGDWHAVPPEAIQKGSAIPPELWIDPAHICAYPRGDGTGYIIECAIINAGS